MKILIVAPSSHLTGGVSFHYKGLHAYWTSEVRYARYGKRPRIPALLCLLPDLLVYIWQLIVFRPDVVMVNPSFRTYQLVRDGGYILLARCFGRKVMAWFHGWDGPTAQRCIASPRLVRWVFGKCSFIYVLSSEFRNQLQAMGLRVPVLLSSTVVDDSLLEGVEHRARLGEVRKLLYLARIDRAKGIYQAIDAFRLAQQEIPHLTLDICGSSEDPAVEEAVKAYVQERGLEASITFRGAVYGEQKKQAYAQGDLYLLPSFGEGMATSVLEALAFGLPVISTPYGGITDYFEEGKMGFLIPTHRPEDIAEKILWLAKHTDACQSISQHNQAYAAKHFLASRVAAKCERDIRTYCLQSPKPRVVSVYPNFANRGGAQNVTMQLATKLNTDHPIVLTATPYAQIPAPYAKAAQFEKFSIRTVWRLANKHTIFISHHRKTTTQLLLLRLFLLRRMRVIHVAHSIFSNLRWCCLFPKEIVAVSQSVKDNLMDYFRIPEKNIRLIYNGIPDCPELTPPLQPDSPIRILHAGKICPLKRQVLLAETLHGKFPPHVQLHFAGSGPDEAMLAKAIATDQQMRFLGQVNIEDILEHYDYVLLFSEKEGLPLTLIEACRQGMPMITNDIPAVCEINEDGRTGFVFPTVASLAEGLANLPRRNSPAYTAMAKAAREKYERLFREEDMIAQYQEIIKNTNL